MRPDEIREMTDDEIAAQVEELAEELFQLKMQGAYQELDNPMRLREIRREIARLKTVRHERELAAAREEG